MEDQSDYLKVFVEDANLYNRILLGKLLPEMLWVPLPHFCQTWLRNYIGGLLVYFISSFLWCFYIYYWKRNIYISQDVIPSFKAIILQIYVSMKALPWYTLLPSISEYITEMGWTKCFPRLYHLSKVDYIVYLTIYLIIVEFGIYWVHKALHDIKPLYKHLHSTHHVYNKQNTLSPFAGLAFHPLDGILHALPHTFALFIVPIHFTSHLVILFFEGIWTTNVHDCIHGNVWPIMGAGYHTIHHTTYRHNYGHYTIWMDWIFGTLCDPNKEYKDKVM